MEFRLLGPLEAAAGGRPVELAGGKAKALLALLLLDAGRVVSVDRIVDDLWGEAVPASAPKMVQIFVSALRKQLGPELIETHPPGYRLRLDGHTLDLRAFEALQADARSARAAGDVEGAAAALAQALGLWRSAPLAEFAEPFARAEGARLAEQQLVCVEERVDVELELGRHAELVAELELLVRRHPLRERLRGSLMLALYRAGRHAEALEAYRSFRRALRDELGIDPPPRLVELERMMLRQERSLGLDPPPETGEEAAPDRPRAAAGPAAGSLDLRILGPLEVRGGDRVLALGGPKRRAVLALLLLEPNHLVPADRLVDGVWGDEPPASARESLQNHVARLRRELGDRIVSRPGGYLVRVEPGELDLERFRRLTADAGRAAPAPAAELLREALSLWRGEPLADLAGEPAARAAAHLAELRLAALEDRIDADLALGRHAQLAAELEELVDREPYRERLRGRLMLALYRSGRQADALAAYADARRALVDGLGAEPGRELQELQRAMLAHDPGLDAPHVPPAPGPAVEPESRRTVTLVVADVVPAAAPADPEARRAAVAARAGAAVAELERHGARPVPLGAGRVLGIFGVPAAADDDALRAVRAAVALREGALAERTALATGEVVTGLAGEGEPPVSGAVVDEAGRLLERAEGGDVLAARRTWRAVSHAVRASRRDEVWEIHAVDASAAPLVRRLETPLVGRGRELGDIEDAFARAVAERRPHLVTVFGAPGVGKTRLAVECTERLRRSATAVVGRCRAGAGEATYAPLRDLVDELSDGDPAALLRTRVGTDAAAQLSVALGLAEGSSRTEDVALAARRLLTGLAREQPLLVVLDDVHWAAPAFLDLVESVVELGDAPVLVLCLARPDLLDGRPQWGGGRLSSSTVLLDALGRVESEALLERLTADTAVARGARARILAVAEGNPLFIEQLLAAAAEDDLDAVPDSIQTLLAARLDRLDEAARAVVQAAAVCGAGFTTEEVAALVDGDPSAALVTLTRRELIRPGEAGDPGREGWSFRHSLIRDVAYGSIPKRRRAELHERRAAHAIEHGRDDDVSAGSHLDLAVCARREAGETGPEVEELAARAAEHLGRAGADAFDRDDSAAAASLLGRASVLLPRDATERAELLPKLGQALVYLGRDDAGRAVLAEAMELADELGDGSLAARARLTRDLALLWVEEPVAAEEMLRDVEEALPALERAGDREGLALAELVRYHALDRLRRLDTVDRLSVALAHARSVRSGSIEQRILTWVCIALPRGTVPVDRAIEVVREISERSPSAYVQASARGALGLLRASQGAFEEGRALVAETHRALEELGLWHSAAAHWIAIGEVEAMAGDGPAAERAYRSGLEVIGLLGDEHTLANLAWRLGLVLAHDGRDDEAETLAQAAARARTAGIWVGVWWRVVLALVEAHRRASADARAHVDEARRQLAAAPESGMHADALLECAEVLRSIGDEQAAAEVVAEAAAIASRLGYVVAARRAEQAQRASTT